MTTSERTAGMERDATAPRAGTEHPARERLYDQARGVTHDIKEMGGLASAAAQEELGQMGDTASACYRHGRDRLCQAERSVEQYIRERPLTSVLIAAGVGAVAASIGRLWMRR